MLLMRNSSSVGHVNRLTLIECCLCLISAVELYEPVSLGCLGMAATSSNLHDIASAEAEQQPKPSVKQWRDHMHGCY